MNLEQRVRQEVDNWHISVRGMNSHSVTYERLIKTIYYGMGIAITEKGIELYTKSRKSENQSKSYTSFKFNEAVKEFKKDLIIYQYLKEGTAKGAARALSVGSNEGNGRVILCEILKRNGLTFNEVKADLEKFRYLQQPSQFNITDNEVVTALNEEIKHYSYIVKPILLQRLITENSQNVAMRFSALAKSIVQEETSASFKIDFSKYEQMTFKEALEVFKTNYLRQQFIESGMNGRLAAKNSGINYGSYKEHMSRRKISMRGLMQQK